MDSIFAHRIGFTLGFRVRTNWGAGQLLPTKGAVTSPHLDGRAAQPAREGPRTT